MASTTDAELIAFRHRLHRHPELSWEERATTAEIADRLATAGLEPVVRPDGVGAVCELALGTGEGPVVGIRGDLDALPVTESPNAPVRSEVDGVSHACGHDVHATATLGAGLLLAAEPPAGVDGRIRLLFQPAEETLPSGAATMVAEGAANDLSAVVALHSDPSLDVGKVGLSAGALTAAYHMVRVHFRGPGGHTARPHLSADVIHAAGRVITDLPGVLSRRVDSRAGVNLTFGHVAAGTAPNVMPEDAIVEGALRCLTTDAWETVHDLVEPIVRSLVEPLGVEVAVDLRKGSPPVHNDAALVETLRPALVDLVGAGNVVTTSQSVGGEDFGWFCLHAPGCYLRLGVRPPGGVTHDLHTTEFAAADAAVPLGARVLATAAVAALGHRG